jgi:hypothetical protein
VIERDHPAFPFLASTHFGTPVRHSQRYLCVRTAAAIRD